MDYEEYQKLADEQRSNNNKLLGEFKSEMMLTGLSAKTVKKHVSNVDFYINEYLLYDDVTSPEDGISFIDGFFDYWFPRKAMWASPAHVNATCTALKKFYLFLLMKNRVKVEDVATLNFSIKVNKNEWLSHYSDESDW